MAGMRKGFYQQHTGTLQFLFLALIFALPLLSGNDHYFVSQQGLEDLLYFETGVVIYGFMLAGFFFIPIALIDSVWTGRVCFVLAVLMAIPFTSGYRQEYGFYGFFVFAWLLFANFSRVFLTSAEYAARARRAFEAGLRCITYVVLFSVLVVVVDLPRRWQVGTATTH